jgi:hypothetical protein
MATRALSALPPTFPAPGVAAAIHRAVTAAGAELGSQGVERRAMPVLSLDAARRGRPRWPRPSLADRPLETRPSLIR